MVTIRRLSTKQTITYHLESLRISKPKYMAVDIQVVAVSYDPDLPFLIVGSPMTIHIQLNLFKRVSVYTG